MTRSETVALAATARPASVTAVPQSPTTGRGSPVGAGASAAPRPATEAVEAGGASGPPRHGSNRSRAPASTSSRPRASSGTSGPAASQSARPMPVGATVSPRAVGRSPAMSARSAPDGAARASSRPSAAATTVVPLPPFGDQQAYSKGTLPGRVGTGLRGKGCGTITAGRALGKGALMLPSMEAAFFDLDKTVIAKASMVAFGRPLYR